MGGGSVVDDGDVMSESNSNFVFVEEAENGKATTASASSPFVSGDTVPTENREHLGDDGLKVYLTDLGAAGGESCEKVNPTTSGVINTPLSVGETDLSTGGENIDEDRHTTSDAVNTLLLVGKTGNGKSATANTILNRKAFVSKPSLSGVTETTVIQRTVMEDGRIVNVIDTPGIFDSSKTNEFLLREKMKCVDLAKDGIDAIFLVFLTRCRYTREEVSALKTLQVYFGEKVTDYMIVLFTGGDVLEEEDGPSFEEFIDGCPEIQELLDLCDRRKILFDNRTEDGLKKARQINELFSLVDSVKSRNGGPFLDKTLAAAVKGVSGIASMIKELDSLEEVTKPESKLREILHKEHEDMLKRVIEILNTRVWEMMEKVRSVEEKLKEEREIRSNVESEIKRLLNDIDNLKDSLHHAEKPWTQKCSIQ